MAQKPYDNDDNAYQFHNEDDAVYDQENNDQTAKVSEEDKILKAKQPVSKKNVVILIIIFILAIFVVYKIFSVLFGHHKKTAPQQTAQVSAMTQQVPADTSAIQRQPSVSASSIPTGAAVATAEQKSITDDAQAQLERNQKLLANLEHQQNETQTRLWAIEQKLSDFEDKLSTLQQTTDSVNQNLVENQKLRSQLAAYEAKMRKSKNQVIREHKQYFVQAVIPGRAWLRGADGTTVTVTVGDSLPGYGKITGIDAYSGIVTLDSGRKIEYGLNN